MSKKLSAKNEHDPNSTGDHQEITATDSGNKRGLDFNDISGLSIPVHDRGTVTYPSNDTEVFTFIKDDVTVATITLTYESSSKENLTSWART